MKSLPLVLKQSVYEVVKKYMEPILILLDFLSLVGEGEEVGRVLGGVRERGAGVAV